MGKIKNKNKMDKIIQLNAIISDIQEIKGDIENKLYDIALDWADRAIRKAEELRDVIEREIADAEKEVPL